MQKSKPLFYSEIIEIVILEYFASTRQEELEPEYIHSLLSVSIEQAFHEEWNFVLSVNSSSVTPNNFS